MIFRPLPAHLSMATALITLCLCLWVAWGWFRNPEALWAPGHLSRYHSDIGNCTGCHTPFHGATTAKCISCHSPNQFARHSKNTVSDTHRRLIDQEKDCMDCHTEHRGMLSQITFGALTNPHGEFVFRATGTQSCNDCHDFIEGSDKPKLLDNPAVNHLLEEGDGAHRRGLMADCLRCHAGGWLNINEGEIDSKCEDD